MSDFLETYLGGAWTTWKPMETMRLGSYVAKCIAFQGSIPHISGFPGSKFLETRKRSGNPEYDFSFY